MTDPDCLHHHGLPVACGTASTYGNHGCRGDACRASKAQLAKAQRARRVGTLANDDPRHGRANTYMNYGCRCDACRAAKAEERTDLDRVLDRFVTYLTTGADGELTEDEARQAIVQHVLSWYIDRQRVDS